MFRLSIEQISILLERIQEAAQVVSNGHRVPIKSGEIIILFPLLMSVFVQEWMYSQSADTRGVPMNGVGIDIPTMAYGPLKGYFISPTMDVYVMHKEWSFHYVPGFNSQHDRGVVARIPISTSFSESTQILLS